MARSSCTLLRLSGLEPPVDGAPEAFVKWHRGLEVEELPGAGHIQAAAGLAVRLGGVPDNLALVADEPADLLGQVLDEIWGHEIWGHHTD